MSDEHRTDAIAPDRQTKKCPMCAEEIPLKADICPYCQTKFVVTMQGYCASCHKVTEVSDTCTCPICGGEIVDLHVESHMVEGAPSAQPTPAVQPIEATPVPSPTPPPQPSLAVEMAFSPIKGEGVNLRWGAVFVDGFLITLAYSLFVALYMLAAKRIADLSDIGDDPVGVLLAGGMILLFPIVWLLYFTILEGTFGTTLGKRTESLKVVRTNGEPCGYARAAVRALLGLFEVIIPLGALVILLSPKKQRIGDMLAGTLVVNKNKLERAEFSQDQIRLHLHDFRQVEFAPLTKAILYKFMLIRQIALKGTDRQGNPTKVKLDKAHFPKGNKFDEFKQAVEKVYGRPLEERLILWRLFGVVFTLVFLIGSTAVIILALMD